MRNFTKCTPEEAGISSLRLIQMLKNLTKRRLEPHAIVLARHGKVFLEGAWEPYSLDKPHPLFSFTKSITSTAIGFACQEGIIRLDEKLVDIYADILPDEVSENMSLATVHDLLCMGCGQESDAPIKGKNSLAKAFFAHPFMHKPGTHYAYNSMGTTMLCDILLRKTGLSLTEYLKPRLLDPLGITSFTCLEFPPGIEFGGGGGKMSAYDMLKFVQFYLQKGLWDGKQLLSPEWIDMAGAYQISTENFPSPFIDQRSGYGYQFWRCAWPGAYRADGAGGQMGVVVPDKDVAAVFTESSVVAIPFLEELYAILREISDEPLAPDPEGYAELKTFLKYATLARYGATKSAFSSVINGKTFRRTTGVGFGLALKANPLSILIAPPEIKEVEVSFIFEENCGVFSVTETDGNGNEYSCDIRIGMDGTFAQTEHNGVNYYCIGQWREKNVLELELRLPENALNSSRYIFLFKEKEAVCCIESLPANMLTPDIPEEKKICFEMAEK